MPDEVAVDPLVGAVPAGTRGVPKTGRITTGNDYSQLADWPALPRKWHMHVPASLPAPEQVVMLDARKLSRYICISFASTHDRGGVVALASLSVTAL